MEEKGNQPGDDVLTELLYACSWTVFLALS